MSAIHRILVVIGAAIILSPWLSVVALALPKEGP
jgi:hypothetical protein